MDDSTSRFWDKFIEKTAACGVTESARRWYVKHIEAFLAAHPGHSPSGFTPEIITRYLEEIGRKPEFPVWRFRQVVDALRIQQT